MGPESPGVPEFTKGMSPDIVSLAPASPFWQ